jgi:predicted hydrocarbon binding protein
LAERETASIREKSAVALKEKIPNRMLYLALVTAEEIVGKNGVRSILNYAGLRKFIDNYPPNDLTETHSTGDYTRIMAGTIELIGERGARAIMFRGGMKAFANMRENFPSLFNIQDENPGASTADDRFAEFARIYGIMVDASVPIWGNIFKYYPCPEGVALEISPCNHCNGLKTREPICSSQVGFQFGTARWVMGRPITIVESHCIAVGDPMCRFVMHRP